MPAAANGTVGSFEVDGDSADSPAGEPIDWSTPPPNVAPIPDSAKSRNDDSFGQGSKELDPGGWVCTTGGVPGKDDLINGSAIAIRVFGGKQYLYAKWLRLSTNGDAHIDYEFNQSNEPGPCPGTLRRTDGDRLVTFDTENGGRTIFVRAWIWNFNAGSTSSGTFTEITSTAEHVTFDGAVNIAPSQSDPNLAPGAFGELSLNLTDTVGTITCGSFAGVHMKTRASTAINSALKDRTLAVPVPGVECPVPNLEIAKSGVQNADGTLTFTITYANSGDGPATEATITDQLPDGTSFSSCTGGCTVSPNGRTVTWSVGPVPPDDVDREVSLTLNITALSASCQICNVARIASPQFNAGIPLPTLPACVTVQPAPDPDGANANGSALGIFASAPGLLASDVSEGESASSQSGPGTPAADDDTVIPVDAASVVTASLINTHAQSAVTAAGAVQESWAETVNVDVLSGLVRASKVLGIARAVATGSSATYGTDTATKTSAFSNLVIDADGTGPNAPVAYENVKPNTSIDVSDVFGAGSYIRLFWLSNNQAGLSGGVYSADATVRMIDVHLADRDGPGPGTQGADVVVSQAIAHADFPATDLCEPVPVQSVLADATIARVERTPVLDPTIVGYVYIPSTGGTSSQALKSVVVDGVLTTGAAESFATGALGATASTASSYAQAKNVCLVPSSGTCTVSATLVKAATSSTANESGASSNSNGTQLVGLKVASISLSDGVPPNTQIVVPGFGILWLNRQLCNIGAQPAPMAPAGPCSSGGSTEITVRALQFEITEATNPAGLPVGSIIVVAESHAGATYI